MSLYINTATGEYPRHPGDVALDPTAPWAGVTPTDQPGPADEGMIWAEDVPELADGEYRQAWKQVPKPVLTREQVLARLGLTADELALLLGA